MKSNIPEWKQFEMAVARFLAALDPNAEVAHDVTLPDKDTGEPRQRDVWIKARVLNCFPITILVSCKKYKRKLDQQHIDAFLGEVRSSGAQKGIIYSHSGFTENAIKKSAKCGISCCRLYQREKPDIPSTLFFDAYLLTPCLHFSVRKIGEPQYHPRTFSDLFDRTITHRQFAKPTKIIDIIEELYYARRKLIREAARKSGNPPSSWSDEIEIKENISAEDAIVIEFGGQWDTYKGKLEGYLIEGSYSFTEDEFTGTQSFPKISKSGPNPGIHWEKIDELPTNIDKLYLVGALYGGNVSIKESLTKYSHNKVQLDASIEK